MGSKTYVLIIGVTHYTSQAKFVGSARLCAAEKQSADKVLHTLPND